MKRYLSLLLVLPLGVFAACASKSDSETPPTAPGETPGDPNAPGGPGTPGTPGGPGGPGATDALKKNPIEGIPAAKQILEAGQFTDGPVWSAKENVLFFTTPLGAGGLYRMKEDGAAMKVLDGDPAVGGAPVGNTIDKAGLLIRVEAKRVMRSAAGGGAGTPIATGFTDPEAGVLPFDTLNDAVMSANGNIYATDPGYFVEPIANRIYRITPAGVVQVVEAFLDVPRPNGIALSPDAKLLYVGFSAPGLGLKPHVRRYHVNADGALGEHAKWAELDMDAAPDGIEVDQGGNVYVATKAGVTVFKSDATKIGVVKVPEVPTGMAFGGKDLKTLYVTTQGIKIYELKVNVPGIVQ
jgi:gluconolactonase